MRGFAGFSFKKDLRSTKTDKDFTRGEKNAITRAWRDYEPMRENVLNGSAHIVKPRHKKNESKTAYKKRLTAIRKSINTDFKYAPYVIAPVPRGSKVTFTKDNKMITQKPNTTPQIFYQELTTDEKIDLTVNAKAVIEDKLAKHYEENPSHPPKIVGLGRFGFVWRMTGIKNIEDLADAFEKTHADYTEQGNDMTNFITNVLIGA